jgi:hypothetical protein
MSTTRFQMHSQQKDQEQTIFKIVNSVLKEKRHLQLCTRLYTFYLFIIIRVTESVIYHNSHR